MRMTTPLVRTLAVLLVFSCVVSFSPQARAEAWGTNIAASIIKESMEKIARQIEGAMLGALKASAIQLLNSQVAGLVGGTSAGGSAVISDWKEWLRDVPEQEVRVAHEQFFNSVLRGRDSSSYHSMLAEQDAGVNNYYDMLAAQMEGFDSSNDVYANAQELVGGDPVAELSRGNLKALNALFAKPTNNPFGLALVYESEMQSVREKAKTEQVVKSLSPGYKGIEENGRTILPAGSVRDIVANSQDIGNKVIAAASKPEELASGVIMTIVNQAVMDSFTRGIGDVQSNIRREINGVNRQVNSQVRTLNRELGPASGFVRDVRKQTDIIVKPSTNPGGAIPRTRLDL